MYNSCMHLMFAQGVGGAKTEVIKVGGVTLMHFGGL